MERSGIRDDGATGFPVLRCAAYGLPLAFDLATSQAYAELMARARTVGAAIGAADGYIAATAAANGMRVATRDTAPFEAAGVAVVNPWEG